MKSFKIFSYVLLSLGFVLGLVNPALFNGDGYSTISASLLNWTLFFAGIHGFYAFCVFLMCVKEPGPFGGIVASANFARGLVCTLAPFCSAGYVMAATLFIIGFAGGSGIYRAKKDGLKDPMKFAKDQIAQYDLLLAIMVVVFSISYFFSAL